MIMQQRENITLLLDGKNYPIAFINKTDLAAKQYENIAVVASGPSINELDLVQLSYQPCIFVNGSISLLKKQHFNHICGYVISDKRFIEHNQNLFQTYFRGQPLYITQPVLRIIEERCPETIQLYYSQINIIEPAITRFKRLQLKNKNIIKNLFFTKRKILAQLPEIILDLSNHQQIIGVSLDICTGFIEAGTVAFIAAQLAFSMGAKQIHLYGVDLLNANAQPRFYESRSDKAPIMLDKAVYNRIIPSFNWMADIYQQYQVQIINHSPVSGHLFPLKISHNEN